MPLPEHTSAQHQADLAEYIRHPQSAKKPHGIDGKRLAVYADLVRNNLSSFINRCFSETRQWVDEKEWFNLQEAFLQQGKPQSPYFRDIPKQFLHFVQKQNRLPEKLLAMMDFEHHQLLAEIAPIEQSTTKWQENSLLHRAKSAFLLHYDVDFISSDFQQIDQSPATIIVWRNQDDEVCYTFPEEGEYPLLAHFFAQADSYQNLLTALATEVEDVEPYRQWLKSHIEKWIIEGVLIVDQKA